MKRRIAVIATALMMSLTGISASGITATVASAASNQIDEQYVVEEDGQTIVYFITYTEPDDVFVQQTVSWYDANGTKYVHLYKTKPEESKKSQQEPSGISSSVTWQDAAGNTYVLDDKTQTVTVYDVDGNIIAVMPA